MNPNPYTLENIRDAVCEINSIDQATLFSLSHEARLTPFKQMFIGCCRYFTSASYPEIAQFMDRVTHSGVHSLGLAWLEQGVAKTQEAYQKVEKLCKEYAAGREMTDTQPSYRGVTTDEIIYATAKRCGFAVKDLLCRRKHHRLTTARQLAMWIIRKNTKCTLGETAFALNRKDHTTVICAMKAVSKRLKEWDDYQEDCTAIHKHLGLKEKSV